MRFSVMPDITTGRGERPFAPTYQTKTASFVEIINLDNKES